MICFQIIIEFHIHVIIVILTGTVARFHWTTARRRCAGRGRRRCDECVCKTASPWPTRLRLCRVSQCEKYTFTHLAPLMPCTIGVALHRRSSALSMHRVGALMDVNTNAAGYLPAIVLKWLNRYECESLSHSPPTLRPYRTRPPIVFGNIPFHTNRRICSFLLRPSGHVTRISRCSCVCTRNVCACDSLLNICTNRASAMTTAAASRTSLRTCACCSCAKCRLVRPPSDQPINEYGNSCKRCTSPYYVAFKSEQIPTSIKSAAILASFCAVAGSSFLSGGRDRP